MRRKGLCLLVRIDKLRERNAVFSREEEMKRILMIAFLAASLGLPAAAPVQLKTFSSILDSLTRGASVRVVFHYG